MSFTEVGDYGINFTVNVPGDSLLAESLLVICMDGMGAAWVG